MDKEIIENWIREAHQGALNHPLGGPMPKGRRVCSAFKGMQCIDVTAASSPFCVFVEGGGQVERVWGGFALEYVDDETTLARHRYVNHYIADYPCNRWAVRKMVDDDGKPEADTFFVELFRTDKCVMVTK